MMVLTYMEQPLRYSGLTRLLDDCFLPDFRVTDTVNRDVVVCDFPLHFPNPRKRRRRV